MPPANLGLLQPVDPETARDMYTVSARAMSDLQKKGITFTSIDPATGQMPIKITSLTDDQLGDLLNRIGTWCSYVDEQLAVADAERTEAKAILENIQARVRLAIRANPDIGRLTNPDKDDMVQTHPSVVEARARYLYTEAIYSLTRTVRDKSQRDWDTVSRRITQRGQEVERMKRDNNVANVPVSSSRFARVQR